MVLNYKTGTIKKGKKKEDEQYEPWSENREVELITRDFISTVSEVLVTFLHNLKLPFKH